jgi:hypothetical protein
VVPEEGSCLSKSGDTYTDSGPIALDGLGIAPVSGVVRVDASKAQLYADNARVLIGSFVVYTGTIPTTNLTGGFTLSTDNTAKIGGLALGAELGVQANSDDLTITGSVSLPKNLGGATVALAAALNATNGLRSIGITATGFSVPLPGLSIGLTNFSLSYDWVSDTWSGSATVSLPTPSGAEVAGSITLAHGQLTNFSLAGQDLNIPLGPDGVFLNNIGAQVALGNTQSITGTGGVTAGPTVNIDGDHFSAVAVDGSLGYTWGNPGDLKLTGTLTLWKGSDFEDQLSSGEVDYYTDGQITVSGDSLQTLGPVSLNVALSGWVDAALAFSLSGSGSLSLGLWQLSGATFEVSNIGVAGCAYPFGDLGPAIGFGYGWGGNVEVMASSCDLGPYTPAEPPVQAGLRRADLGGQVYDVALPGGLPVASFKIAGAGTAPSGTLTDPEGRRVTIEPAHQGVSTGTTPRYGLAVDARAATDYIAVDAPTGGTWRFTPSAGSSVKSLESANGLPKPELSGSVSGTALQRALSWRIADIPGQRVTFVEQGRNVHHVLAAGVAAPTGRLVFTPADGPGGQRTVVGIVTQGGLAREFVPIASFHVGPRASLQLLVTATAKAHGYVKVTPPGAYCKSTCSVSLAAGEPVKLVPVPAKGSQFTWQRGSCRGHGVCVLTLTQKVSLVGLFAPVPASRHPKPVSQSFTVAKK